MAIAGKVAITPKGEWNASTAYQKLDLVYYNNASYVAIRPSTGVTPTNTTYWMLVLQSAGEADLAKYLPLTGGTVNGNILQDVSGDTGVRHRLSNGKRNVYQNINENGYYQLYDGTNKKSIIYSTADGTTTFDGTASGNLPLNGSGTVTTTGREGITLKRTNGNMIATRYEGTSGKLGEIGFTDIDKPTFITSDGNSYHELLHTGNITDYVAADSETGTFTLKLDGVTLGTGTYYKVGKMVHCRATGNLPQVVDKGYVSLTGFPFANASLNGSTVDFHVHQYYGKASDNLVFNVGASEITLDVTATIGQNQPFNFSTIYFTA